MSSGYQQPPAFSSEQYRALRDGAGALIRPDRRILRVSGSDRRHYLQGLLTNDIAAVGAGAGCYAAFLTPQGRMIADMRVLETGSEILMDLDAATAGEVRTRLEQFIFSEDVKVDDQSGELTVLGVYGPRSADVLARALISGGAASSALPVELSVPLHDNVPIPFDGSFVRIVRSDEIGVDGFDLVAGGSHVERLRNALLETGATRVDAATAEITRIEAGRPAWGRELTPDIIPLEAGIEDRAISQTKGCYVGQEVIIRVLHRGHGRVARRLVGLAVMSGEAPAAGDRVRSEGRDIGFVTSAAFSPALERAIALGYVHRDFVEPETRVTIARGGESLGARVARLPFVERSTKRMA